MTNPRILLPDGSPAPNQGKDDDEGAGLEKMLNPKTELPWLGQMFSKFKFTPLLNKESWVVGVRFEGTSTQHASSDVTVDMPLASHHQMGREAMAGPFHMIVQVDMREAMMRAVVRAWGKLSMRSNGEAPAEA